MLAERLFAFKGFRVGVIDDGTHAAVVAATVSCMPEPQIESDDITRFGRKYLRRNLLNRLLTNPYLERFIIGKPLGAGDHTERSTVGIDRLHVKCKLDSIL